MAFVVWGYKSLAEWGRDDLGIAQPTISRFVAVGRHVASLPGEEQRRWLQQPVWNAVELLPLLKQNPPHAINLLESGRTQAQIRQAVRESTPELHHPTQFRTLRFTLSQEALDEWRRALNIARFLAHETNPSDETLIRAIVANFLLEPLGEKAEKFRAEIEEGKIRCTICGSFNASEIEGHHVIPRSHGGSKGPTCWLCHTCHQKVTENVDGGWRALAKLLGVDPDHWQLEQE